MLGASYGIELRSVGSDGRISVAVKATIYGASVKIRLRDQVKFVNLCG